MIVLGILCIYGQVNSGCLFIMQRSGYVYEWGFFPKFQAFYSKFQVDVSNMALNDL